MILKPLAARTVLGFGLGVVALAARLMRERSAQPRATATSFRSEPHDDVMLVEVA